MQALVKDQMEKRYLEQDGDREYQEGQPDILDEGEFSREEEENQFVDDIEQVVPVKPLSRIESAQMRAKQRTIPNRKSPQRSSQNSLSQKSGSNLKHNTGNLDRRKVGQNKRQGQQKVKYENEEDPGWEISSGKQVKFQKQPSNLSQKMLISQQSQKSQIKQRVVPVRDLRKVTNSQDQNLKSSGTSRYSQ